jgi:hypothetical protein
MFINKVDHFSYFTLYCSYYIVQQRWPAHRRWATRGEGALAVVDFRLGSRGKGR